MARYLDAVVLDATQVVRRLRRRWTGALAVLVTVALVVGAGTSLLAVVSATLVRPLPYPDGDRLFVIQTQPPGTSSRADRGPLHAIDIARFRRELTTVEAVEGAWARDRALGGAGEPVSVEAAQVTPGFLTLLGARIAAGRFWTDAEDDADARVAVISHGLWQRQFGGDPGVVGRTIRLDREAYQVIGVLAAGFRPSFIVSELWTPLHLADGANTPNPRNTYIPTIARAQPGISEAVLRDEVQAAMRRIVADLPATHNGWSADVLSLREQEYGDHGRAFAMLGAAIGVLALIAIANLANLRLARAIAERNEIGMRLALGASWLHLVRLQLVEDVLLGAIGAGLGVALAFISVPLLMGLDPNASRTLGQISIDWAVVGAAAALALAVSVTSGLVPVMREARRQSLTGSSGRRAVGSRRDTRFRRLLVAAEAGLALVLLVVGALMLATVSRLSERGLGFDAANVLAAQMRLPESAYPNTRARARVVADVLEAVRALPGVVAASTTQNPFRRGIFFVTQVEIEGRRTPDGAGHFVQFRRASDGYFETMRIPVLDGRAISARDTVDSPQVAIVSQSMAERFWPGERAVGRRITRAGSTLEVVGVVGDVRDVGAAQPPGPTVYVAYAQNNAAIAVATMVVRTAGPPADAVAAIRAKVLEIDPDLPLEGVGEVAEFMTITLGPDRFRGTLLGVIAGLGLLLAAVGIYGVTACAVEERTREIGVRLALGANARGVWWLVVAQAVRTVAFGAAAGAAASAAVVFALRTAVPNLDWADAWSVAPAAAVLAVAACVAAGIPAAFALRADPTVVLRQ
ncbi:MAG TPA: ADOP family duplicated permease [Vicinamibacterales bacterium]|nr:ADOP family duplicated permease [Vicinamibacterales bacterium]